MPSSEIRAQKGVPMALTERDGMLVQWDGTTLRYTCGKPWLRGRGECWTVHHRALYVMRESEWVRVLPPLDEPEPVEAVTVGYAVEPPKPDTKALLIKKAIADLELARDRASACRNYYTMQPSSSIVVADFRRIADSMSRVLETLKEASDG